MSLDFIMQYKILEKINVHNPAFIITTKSIFHVHCKFAHRKARSTFLSDVINSEINLLSHGIRKKSVQSHFSIHCLFLFSTTINTQSSINVKKRKVYYYAMLLHIFIIHFLSLSLFSLFINVSILSIYDTSSKFGVGRKGVHLLSSHHIPIGSFLRKWVGIIETLHDMHTCFSKHIT